MPPLSPVERAYASIFDGSANSVIVLRDLMEATRFNNFMDVREDINCFVDHNAKRTVLAHILQRICSTPSGSKLVAEVLASALTPAPTEESET